jgi:hypothetical protein
MASYTSKVCIRSPSHLAEKAFIKLSSDAVFPVTDEARENAFCARRSDPIPSNPIDFLLFILFPVFRVIIKSTVNAIGYGSRGLILLKLKIKDLTKAYARRIMEIKIK